MSSTEYSKAIIPHLTDMTHVPVVKGIYKVPLKRRLVERYAQGVRMTMKEFRR